MSDPTPIKVLFQFKPGTGKGDHLRLVLLLQENVLRDLLKAVEKHPAHCAHIETTVPVEDAKIIIEAYRPEGLQKNDLVYTKMLQDEKFTTTHVNIV